MSKVSTRPQKVATPATTPSKPVAAAPVENEGYTPAKLKKAFGMLADTLRQAAHTDEPHALSGDSDRLLNIAADLARAAHDNVPEATEAERLGYNIAALVIASRTVPGDTYSLERQAYVAQAKPVLAWITEAGDVLRDGAAPNTRPLVLAGEEGLDVVLRCVWDIDPLADLVITLAGQMPIDNGPQPAIVRALGVRVKELNSVVMSYVGGDDLVTLHDARYVVYRGADCQARSVL